MMDDCMGEETDNGLIKSKWIIRMEFNQEIC